MEILRPRHAKQQDFTGAKCAIQTSPKAIRVHCRQGWECSGACSDPGHLGTWKEEGPVPDAGDQ